MQYTVNIECTFTDILYVPWTWCKVYMDKVVKNIQISKCWTAEKAHIGAKKVPLELRTRLWYVLVLAAQTQ